MERKRIEMYVGWTCNHQCVYCMEYPNMIKQWKERISAADILKLLIKYKRQWYNHVTFLWGEPFIQEVFFDALKIAKKLGYTTLVTTNATTLHIEREAKKYLSLIDELILSVEAIDYHVQEQIAQTKALTHWEKVFENVHTYAKLALFKANIVINQLNKTHIYDIVDFIVRQGIKEVVLTYPDIDLLFYKKKHIVDKVAPRYSEVYDIIKRVFDDFWSCVSLKIADIPLCTIRNPEYIRFADDYNYENRVKLAAYSSKNVNYSQYNKTLDRKKTSPRKRRKIEKCQSCAYKKTCWGVAEAYETLYGLEEISPAHL